MNLFECAVFLTWHNIVEQITVCLDRSLHLRGRELVPSGHQNLRPKVWMLTHANTPDRADTEKKVYRVHIKTDTTFFNIPTTKCYYGIDSQLPEAPTVYVSIKILVCIVIQNVSNTCSTSLEKQTFWCFIVCVRHILDTQQSLLDINQNSVSLSHMFRSQILPYTTERLVSNLFTI